MGKLKEKGKAGAARNFITRTQALKKLQVTLADFRRLCILKGIYPREPRNKKKANKGSTAPRTFYYYKDIQYLLHEPIIEKFREHKIFARKLSKALGKGELCIAKRLDENRPRYTLDHILRERYPSFLDALRDLDDALTMIFLFAYLPTTDRIPSTVTALCERLANEFQHYVIRTNSLRKVFLSIKGIYYQAEIMNQDITWIVPYKFSQKIPEDVDFRIMLTFLEFYQTFVGFTNFKLYSDIGLVYPPKLDHKMDGEAAGIYALKIEKTSENLVIEEPQINDVKDTSKQRKTLGAKLKSLSTRVPDPVEPVNEEIEDVELDTFEPLTANDTTLAAPQQLNTLVLFKNLSVFLSREVPRHTLEFPLLAFGARVSWDPVLGGGSVLTEDSETITHQIVDRTVLPNRYPGRSYIQPQWVVDSINQGKLLPVAEYAPGAALPPHLSPFVRVDPSGYDPTIEIDDSQEEDDDDEVDEEAGLQQELEAEAKGIMFSDYKASAQVPKRKRQVEEEDLRNIMMSNKQKKLYKKMKYSNQKKEEMVKRLKKRRKSLDKSK